MNNADMPAMPLSDARIGEHAASNFALGLTKREYFAGLAMQGIISKGCYGNPCEAATDSVELVDALLEELERTK